MGTEFTVITGLLLGGVSIRGELQKEDFSQERVLEYASGM
jgi:hypothetical protein